MNRELVVYGSIILIFCALIMLLPNIFNLGSIIGVGIFILIMGIVEKEDKK